MISKLQINNYKSLHELELDVGRFNVLIGENGCGKSNVLEAIALAAAAAADKLDNEFLVSRGIRVTEPQLMRAAFSFNSMLEPIKINLGFENLVDFQKYILHNDNQPYSKWSNQSALNAIQIELMIDILNRIKNESTTFRHIELLPLSSQRALIILVTAQTEVINFIINLSSPFTHYELQQAAKYLNIFSGKDLANLDEHLIRKLPIYEEETPESISQFEINEENTKKILEAHNFRTRFKEFTIFSAENSALRNFSKEGQIEPLGINGEGLLKLLKVIQSKSPEQLEEIVTCLELFDWFDGLHIPKDFSSYEDKVTIADRFLSTAFDQRSANEGFLFVLFYIALMVSDDTPKIFAIDNIDVALNPKLCTKLIKELVRLAKKYDKQVFVTTHNPAILDGIDLGDDEQRLLVGSRNKQGHTRFKRIELKDKPRSSTNEELRLSEAFLRGYLGGLPKGF
ncbi:MAG: AAA family ATPase [Methylococcaceae bacterium]|nr:AAA family ATPase [Methylococcaceae bacterium]